MGVLALEMNGSVSFGKVLIGGNANPYIMSWENEKHICGGKAGEK